MTNHLPITADRAVRFLNHADKDKLFNTTNEAMISFAIDDAIAEVIGSGHAPATIRIWVHEPTIVLGIPDSRLPYLDDGLAYIAEQGTKAVIRNSGGLAVFLDPGVLNMSIIIPASRKLSINDGYDMMLQFIRELFKPYTEDIEAYEIVGSYCPGDYDLSIHGIKFAGISQRRIRNGIAVQIYLDIAGSSQARAKIVKDFYAISLRGASTTYDYPNINPNVMGTVNGLLGTSFTVNDCISMIRQLLAANYGIEGETLLLEEEEPFLKRLKQMQKRNERLHR